MEMSGEHHTLASHCTPGKEPWYPLSRRLSGSFEDEKKNLFSIPGFKLRLSNTYLVSVLTMLY
jgi:hypothetical protein